MNKYSHIATADRIGAHGTLRLSRLGSDGEPSEATYQSVFVPGTDYAGLEDNDIRGFLDGTFFLPWNQATQTHLRIGRFGYGGPGSAALAGKPPIYGEHELFRVLQCWSGIALPPGASVTDARLSVGIEDSPELSVRVFIYAVRRRWNPGAGGVHRNNVSVAAPGEVWWNDAASEVEPWGLPGAGFAADADPRADTAAEPLASAVCHPGDERIEFRSGQLSDYVSETLAAGHDLRFLIKLSDSQEDIPGLRVLMWSAETGDERNPVRRPRMEIEWSASEDQQLVERPIRLEPGRSLDLPIIDCLAGGTYGVGFVPFSDHEAPTVFLREQCAGVWSDWTESGSWLRATGDRLQLRVTAAVAPIQLGSTFESSLREPWVLAGPPEQLEVCWSFLSPTGRSRDVAGVYRGDFRWSVEFVPDEVGAWTYCWRHDLRSEDVGPTGRFDVVAWSLEAVRGQLAALADEAACLSASGEIEEVERLRVSFSRLQRAAMSLLDPEAYARAMEGELGDTLRNARTVLWGRPMPREIERKSMARHTTWEGQDLEEPFPRITAREQPVPPGVRKRILRRVRAFLARMDTAFRSADRGARQK